MKSTSRPLPFRRCLPALLTCIAGLALSIQQVAAADALSALFGDPVLVKGKGVEVKQSQLDEEFITLRASLAGRQQELPEAARPKAEISLLEQLIISQILAQKATESDRTNAAAITKRFLENARKETGNSEEAFARSVRAMGMSVKQYEERFSRQSLTETVIERELKPTINISDDDVKKFYDENHDRFQRPEIAKGYYILVQSKDPRTGVDLPPEVMKPKRERLQRALSRARSGEDFQTLIKEYTEEPENAENRGEFTIPKINRLPEVESVVFSSPINGITDIVAAAGALHIMKVTERLPSKLEEFSKLKEDIRKDLGYREMAKKLPEYYAALKKSAGLTVLVPKYNAVLETIAPPKPAGE